MYLGDIVIEAKILAERKQQQVDFLLKLEKQYADQLKMIEKFKKMKPPIRQLARVSEQQIDVDRIYNARKRNYDMSAQQIAGIEANLSANRLVILKKRMEIRDNFPSPIEVLPSPKPKSPIPQPMPTEGIGAKAVIDAKENGRRKMEQQRAIEDMRLAKLNQEAKRRSSWAREATRVIRQPTQTRPFRSTQPFSKPEPQVRKVEVLPAIIDKKANMLPVAIGAGVLLLFMGK